MYNCIRAAQNGQFDPASTISVAVAVAVAVAIDFSII